MTSSTRRRLAGITPDRRSAEARVRRPRRLLRRRRGCADRPAALRRVRGRTPCADRQRRLDRVAAGFRPGLRRSVARRHPVVGSAPVEAAEAPVAAAASGEPTVGVRGETRGDTCHIDVVDRWGNIVSATPSGGWLQSSPTSRSVGFCLGTRLQMTWLEPGHPSTLSPGRRPRTTLTPTLVAAGRRGRTPRSARPAATSRTSGSCCSCCARRRRLHPAGGDRCARASTPPRCVSSFWPRTWEPARRRRRGPSRRRGHRGTPPARAPDHVAGAWSLGRLSAVSWSDGIVRAAANPRGMQGYAVGR